MAKLTSFALPESLSKAFHEHCIFIGTPKAAKMQELIWNEIKESQCLVTQNWISAYKRSMEANGTRGKKRTFNPFKKEDQK